MPIKVLKASAGSGKTHRLTNDYIDLLNKSTHNQILAVTFTNKATEEMKSRIVETLYKRVTEKGDSISKGNLNSILHDYSHFNVSTIDKFFQKIVRSMFRELGFSGLYNLVLDKTQLIEESVDEMRMNLDQYNNAYNLLLDHAIAKLKEGEDWSFSKELKRLTTMLWKEEFMNLTQDELSCYKYDNVKQFFSEAVAERNKILDEWATLAEKTKKSFTSVGLDLKKDSSSGILTRLDSFIGKKINFFTEKQQEKLSLLGVLTKEKFKKYSDVLISAGFDNYIEEFATSYNNNLLRYNTINAVVTHAIYLPVIVEIYSLIRNRLQEKNEFLLSEINHLLAGMIGDEDAPFIYEKVGTQIKNYLLDEFQDTSSMQWKNFIPLIGDSVASGYESLIVGDVKQSIYRWRNSDWNILAKKIKEEFGDNSEEDSLTNNWRTLKNIVDFNNSFFSKLVEGLQDEDISKLYSDVKQGIDSERKNSDGGYVNWKVWKNLKNDTTIDYKEKELEAIYNDIIEVLDKGFKKKDIGILVRTKKQGVLISEYLLNKGINVISSESLLVSSSNDVRCLIYLLKMLVDKDDAINKFQLESLQIIPSDKFQKESNNLLSQDIIEASRLPLFEQVERYIQILNLKEKKESIVYIQAFQDIVFAYNQKYSSNVNGFLSWWELEGKNYSIEGSAGVDAVNILTIHKSKGLDFPIVFVPFCEWSLTSKDELKWFKNNSESFNKYLPLLPLKINKDLEKTIYKEEYNKEMLYKKVDSLNLIYVALTRPKYALYIYSAPGNKHDIYKWVDEVMQKYTSDVLCNIIEDEILTSYSFGTLLEAKIIEERENKEEKKESKENKVESCECGYPSVDYNNENSNISLNFQTENFIQHKGNVLHGILQNIKTKSDADKAINKAIRMGLISTVEVPRINKDLEKIFNNPQTCSWYDGTYQKIWNERTIISDNNNYRPDRIMEKDGELLVVDYKFGQPKQEHLNQLSKYVELLQGMGKWTSVRGCLYYHKDQSLQCID